MHVKFSNWKDTAELVGMVAIVGSLVFVGMQLKLDRDVSIIDARANLADRVNYLTEIVNSNADVWRRGLDNEELTATEEIQFQSLCASVYAHVFTQWVRWRYVGPVDPDVAAQRFAYAVYAHPGLRRVYNSSNTARRDRDAAFNIDGFQSEFVDIVDAYLLELEQSRPAPIRDYVFWSD